MLPTTPSRAFLNCVRPHCRVVLRGVAIVVLLQISAAARLAAADPHISYIELLSSNQVTIHFETVANRTYTLQFLNTLSCPTNGSVACSPSRVPTGSWSNLWVAPRLPYAEHYVIVDSRTNRMRFYRLKVSP